jgi:hypothetical protein
MLPLAADVEATATELPAPALGVPVATFVGIVPRHDDEVPEARADHVIAAGAAIGLLSTHVPYLVSGDDRPPGGIRAR